MKKLTVVFVTLLSTVVVADLYGQPPGGPDEFGRGGPRGQRGFGGGRPGEGPGHGPPVERLMAMDANGDGQLDSNEMTDDRLRPMLKRADANQDGVVTRAELEAMFAQHAEAPTGPERRRGPDGSQFGGPGERGGPGGPGGGPGFGRDGERGGPGRPDFDRPEGPGFGGPPSRGRRGESGPFGPPPTGEVLPVVVQDDLGLSPPQREALQKLQADVTAQLKQILTADQWERLQKGPRDDRGPRDNRGPRGDRGPRGRGGDDFDRGPRRPPAGD